MTEPTDEPRPPLYQWRLEPCSVVVQAYLCNQYRLQVWWGRDKWPDILSPEC